MPKYKNHKKTQKYSNDFKGKAVVLTLQKDARVKVIAEMLDIHPFMLSRWRKEYAEGIIPMPKKKKELADISKKSSEHNKIRKLERENQKLKMENDLLKKWQRFLAEQKHNGSSS